MPKKNKNLLPLPLWIYIIGWLFFAYLFIQILGFKAENSNNLFLSGLYFIDFGVHEASHLVVFFLPPILVASAGSIGEMGFTILILAATLKAKSYYASVFAGIWIMLSMNSAGRYMADARSQLLPLIGPGEYVKHDWNYVFSQTGLLKYDNLIGGTVRGIGDIIGFLALAFGLWLIFAKFTQTRKKSI
ncbi:MAG: hypothetical protein NTV39_04320 [Candidatus Saccharibacteria bacterium]|nr:hypothetical protein [Candidatus Saccharibacteria bacterium]